MKSVLIVSAMMAVGFAGSTQAAKKYAPDPLADIIAGGCSVVQVAPFGSSLLAAWSWENGDGQRKFGGDAVYTVVFDDESELEVEFEVEQYEPGTAPEDYTGQLVYRCSNAQTDASGSCNGSVLGLRSAIQAAVEDAGYTMDDVVKATLVEVGVKALKKGKGRQNYDKVDVCDLPI